MNLIGNVLSIFLYKTKFGPCVDCRRCLSGDFVCPVDDEMQYFYKRLDDADVVIVGTPIYWFGPSGPAKLFLDRLRPYYRSRRLEGKVLALLLPAADGDGDCDLTIEMFRRSASLLGMKFAGAVTAKAFDAGEVIGDSDVERAAAELVDKIAAL